MLLVAGCAVTPPAEDPVLIQLEELDRRLGAIERILANGSLVELTMQVDDMQRQNAELQGRTESLEHSAESTASRQRDLYIDVDDRIQSLERSLQSQPAAVNVLDGGALLPGQLPVPGGSDRDNYQAAFELLKEQRYEPAALAFQQFLISYPDSQLADNAQYWLAESFYVTDQFENALKEFQVVINKHPRSRKVPDALLKIGYSNYELERYDAARTSLGMVQSEYPDTTAARLAEQRLKRMDDEA
ncbi:MAG: tol-pal system protein YbgF [Gammaproteobacteria bacterium]|jgi:tol-pal system protein YbgF|nr:MAG: tol-pal system protein YbgF [Gammaproteobacteria bacterium]